MPMTSGAIGYLVRRPDEEGQGDGHVDSTGTQLVTEVREAVTETSALVDNPLRQELTLPPLVVARRPSTEGTSR